jgi:hypothetical protein
VGGWAMASHLRSELVVAAREMALRAARPLAWSTTPPAGASTTSSPSGSACATLVSSPRWAQSATATTMPVQSASSPGWNANSSIAAPGAPTLRRAWTHSSLARAFPTRADGTRPWASSAPPPMQGGTEPRTPRALRRRQLSITAC